jgi:hypothetical protein
MYDHLPAFQRKFCYQTQTDDVLHVPYEIELSAVSDVKLFLRVSHLLDEIGAIS